MMNHNNRHLVNHSTLHLCSAPSVTAEQERPCIRVIPAATEKTPVGAPLRTIPQNRPTKTAFPSTMTTRRTETEGDVLEHLMVPDMHDGSDLRNGSFRHHGDTNQRTPSSTARKERADLLQDSEEPCLHRESNRYAEHHRQEVNHNNVIVDDDDDDGDNDHEGDLDESTVSSVSDDSLKRYAHWYDWNDEKQAAWDRPFVAPTEIVFVRKLTAAVENDRHSRRGRSRQHGHHHHPNPPAHEDHDGNGARSRCHTAPTMEAGPSWLSTWPENSSHHRTNHVATPTPSWEMTPAITRMQPVPQQQTQQQQQQPLLLHQQQQVYPCAYMTPPASPGQQQQEQHRLRLASWATETTNAATNLSTQRVVLGVASHMPHQRTATAAAAVAASPTPQVSPYQYMTATTDVGMTRTPTLSPQYQQQALRNTRRHRRTASEPFQMSTLHQHLADLGVDQNHHHPLSPGREVVNSHHPASKQPQQQPLEMIIPDNLSMWGYSPAPSVVEEESNVVDVGVMPENGRGLGEQQLEPPAFAMPPNSGRWTRKSVSKKILSSSSAVASEALSRHRRHRSEPPALEETSHTELSELWGISTPTPALITPVADVAAATSVASTKTIGVSTKPETSKKPVRRFFGFSKPLQQQRQQEQQQQQQQRERSASYELRASSKGCLV